MNAGQFRALVEADPEVSAAVLGPAAVAAASTIVPASATSTVMSTRPAWMRLDR